MSPTRSLAHIRTSRNIRGFRVGRYSTGISMARAGNAAIVREEKALASRQRCRVWLAARYRAQWTAVVSYLRGSLPCNLTKSV